MPPLNGRKSLSFSPVLYPIVGPISMLTVTIKDGKHQTGKNKPPKEGE
jgi:hypothetical protein